MRLLFLLEVIYKSLGFIITMLLARVLGPGHLGDYQFYQSNVFGYLNSASLFSTDYKNRIAFQANDNYSDTDEYYLTFVVKSITILLSICILSFFWERLDEFSLLPYAFAIASNIFQLDFLIFGHSIQKPFALIRLLSQTLSLSALVFFSMGLVDVYWITIYQLIQTSTINIGVLFLVRKYIEFDWLRYFKSFKLLRLSTIVELSRYFVANQFVVYVTTIEALLLAVSGYNEEMRVFTEGQRLSQVLVPSVILYLNYQIGKKKKNFNKYILSVVILLLFMSPATTLVLYGESYLKNISYYNYFLVMFLLIVVLREKVLTLLSADLDNNKPLARFNLLFFILSTATMLGLILYGLSVEVIIVIFLLKLTVYHWLYNRRFDISEQIWFLPVSVISLCISNIILREIGYYSSVGAKLVAIQHIVVSGFAP